MNYIKFILFNNKLTKGRTEAVVLVTGSRGITVLIQPSYDFQSQFDLININLSNLLLLAFAFH